MILWVDSESWLRAIVMDGIDTQFRRPQYQISFKKAVKNAVKTKITIQVGKDLRAYSTAIWINSCDAANEMPIYNHALGSWIRRKAIDGPALAKVVT